MAILHTRFPKIDHLGPVSLVPFCAMRDSICFIPVVCKKQASQELLLWYGLALYEFTYMVSSFAVVLNCGIHRKYKHTPSIVRFLRAWFPYKYNK